MSLLEAKILGIGLWTPGFANVPQWLEGVKDDEVSMPGKALLNRQTARRASRLTRAMAESYRQSLDSLEIDLSTVRTVFGSALGEGEVTTKLLWQMSNKEDFSPMLFAVSVHNAASGVVSISNKNREFTTSLAADADTPAMGLMETFALMHSSEEPAALICGDDASPEGLVPDEEAFDLVAGALVLQKYQAGEDPRLGILSLPTRSKEEVLKVSLADSLRRNCQAGLLNLIDHIARKQPGTIALDYGAGKGWQSELRFTP